MFDLNWFRPGAEVPEGSLRTRYLCERFRALLCAVERLCDAGCEIEPTGSGFRCTPPKGAVPAHAVEGDHPDAAIRLYLDNLGVAEPFVYPDSAPTAVEYEARYAALRDRPDVSALLAAEERAKFEQMLSAGSGGAGN
jgi:hypothetical protein